MRNIEIAFFSIRSIFYHSNIEVFNRLLDNFFFLKVFYQSREFKSLLNYRYFRVNDLIVYFKNYILIFFITLYKKLSENDFNFLLF